MIKMYESVFNEDEMEMDERKKKKDKEGDAPADGEVVPSQQILEILSSKKFAKWFEGKFADYKAGEDGAPTEEEILADIQSTFIDEMEGKSEEDETPADESAEEPADDLEEDWRSQ